MASRIYVTVASETRVLFEADYALSDMACAAEEFVRLVKVARDGTSDPWPKEPVSSLVTVSMTVDHELPSVLYWETSGSTRVNGSGN